MHKLLIIDDNKNFSEDLQEILSLKGYKSIICSNFADAEFYIESALEANNMFSLILVDLNMDSAGLPRLPNTSGLRLFPGHKFVKYIAEKFPDILERVVIISGHDWYRKEHKDLFDIPFISKYDDDITNQIIEFLESED